MVQDRIYNYFERNPQLHVLFIFDRMDVIGSELRDLPWNDGYQFHTFDGAWFNTKYAVENDWKEKKVVLLFPNGTYPHTEEEMLRFPLLDLLKANMEFKEDDHDRFMQQYGLPAQYAPFIQRNITELQSAKISHILEGYFTKETFSEDLVCRAFVSSYLNCKKLQDWNEIILQMFILELESEQRKKDTFYYKLEKSRDAKTALNHKLEQIFDRSYAPNSELKMKEPAECMKYNLLTQLLDVVSTDSYKTYKITNSFQLDHINKIYETAIHHPLWGEKFETALDFLTQDTREESLISCYGLDANYFYITENLCWPMLQKTVKERLLADPTEVNDKMRELSLKLPQNAATQIVIRFIELLALYYDKVRNLGSLKLKTPDDYVKRYVTEFHTIDLIYRRCLEAYHQLMTQNIPIEQSLAEAKKAVDEDYARTVNVINLEWLTCVNEHPKRFGAVSLPKQQDFYRDELDPSTKKVVIVCDAMRYEVAAELMEMLAKGKHIAELSALCTMLPTETKYCKPALLPHHDLSFQDNEMLVDGQVLTTTDLRTAHVNKYREGSLCINYENFMGLNMTEQREICKRPLVYLFYNTIDEASHSQSPFEVIRACRSALEQLSSLVNRLHASLNVANVLLTADHGFIYNDMEFEEKDKHSIQDETLEKKTRYYLTLSGEKQEGISKFGLHEVSAMTTEKPVQVAVPTGTNRLAAPGGYNFAHGGATLQEMIIPLIHSSLRRKDKTDKVGVTLLSPNLNMVSSQLRFQLIQTVAVSMNIQERCVCCCVYEGDNPVTVVKEVMLDSTDSENLNNRVFDMSLVLNKTVSSNLLQLRVWDKENELNPLIVEAVKNNTIIEQDF